MKWRKTIFILGAVVAITPFTGFTEDFKTYVFSVVGLVLVFISAISFPWRREESSDTYKDNGGHTPESR